MYEINRIKATNKYDHLTPAEEVALRMEFHTQVKLSYKWGVFFTVTCPCCRVLPAASREVLAVLLLMHIKKHRADRMRRAIGLK